MKYVYNVYFSYNKVCAGMGSAITNVHKEIYKVSRHYLTDRVMAVRCAAAKVLIYTKVMSIMCAPFFKIF